MKTYKIIILALFSFYTAHGQLPSADMAKSYEHEMERFNSNIEFYYKSFLAGYNDFYPLLERDNFKVMNSKRSYDPLVPMEFNFFMKIVDKVVPGSEKVSKILTGLLEKGWTEHNKEIEANRKESLKDEQTISFMKNMNDKADFQYTMGPFRTHGSQPSDFQSKINALFYQNNKTQARLIWEELHDINDRLEQHPIFTIRGTNSDFVATKMFYENYIMQLAKIRQNEIFGTVGSLYIYLKFDNNFKLVKKAIVPDVPAGYEIGQNLNAIFSKEKKVPLDLKVVKVFIIDSPYYDDVKMVTIRKPWKLTLTVNNQIPWRKEKMDFGFPELPPTIVKTQPSMQYKHAIRFLKEYGEMNKSGLWSVKKSLFEKFTEDSEEGVKKLPDIIRYMIDPS